MIPKHMELALAEAWRAGGSRAYCFLGVMWDWACKARDYELAAICDWLEDVLNERTDAELRLDDRVSRAIERAA